VAQRAESGLDGGRGVRGESWAARRRSVVVRNLRDVDIVVRDARGFEHLLFPGEEKRIERIVIGRKGEKKCL
jgi:hypothetical protein